jgi:dTDP-4-dehydrorhamnose 3,5-epimerase
MSRFTISHTSLAGLTVVQRKNSQDERGFLSKLFCVQELGSVGWEATIAQVNHTYTKSKGTVRGMHFQIAPYSERKLVSCIRGSVWDVAVDIRAGSSTFLKWHAEVLSADNLKALNIPQGFAHGFQALTDDAELIYMHTESYVPNSEAGMHPCDPLIQIHWPLPISQMSTRDDSHAKISDSFLGVLDS